MERNGRAMISAYSFEVESETGMVVVALHHKSLTFAYLQADIAILIFITIIIRGYPQPRTAPQSSSNTSQQTLAEARSSSMIGITNNYRLVPSKIESLSLNVGLLCLHIFRLLFPLSSNGQDQCKQAVPQEPPTTFKRTPPVRLAEVAPGPRRPQHEPRVEKLQFTFPIALAKKQSHVIAFLADLGEANLSHKYV
ncbi:hypothetical protein F5144DRAFT_332709 [Chaetomium tenue]|uniref:Uncharacterized protein n=1 Tax=Chaetomium tenue TaxID=1854479 RepID=A0ACB7NW97_9PEZI|nr:hypothetical protein F5144DRAFT_332709 [Chaetomium globosum]